MFRVSVYTALKDGKHKLKKHLPEVYETYTLANKACEQKNKDLGVDESGIVKPGQSFAMFDQVNTNVRT